MFPMLVEEELEDWPEKNLRKRKWVCIKTSKIKRKLYICEILTF